MSLWDMLHFACSSEDFPLSLTLSFREREKRASVWCLANGRWANSGTSMIERRWIILPLLRGEGGGEGEPIVAPSRGLVGKDKARYPSPDQAE